jgi:uncharacterized protein
LDIHYKKHTNKMKILIDIGHPAHVHFFSQFSKKMISNGHEVLFTTREKDVTIELLQHYKFKYISFGKTKKGLLLKAFGLITFSIRIFLISKKYKPDIFLAHGGIYQIFSSFLLGIPLISNLNTDSDPFVNVFKFFLPVVISPSSFSVRINKRKHIPYPGNCELAFLHPNHFVPDSGVLKKYGIEMSEKFVLVRFVSFSAFDDIGKSGITETVKTTMIRKLRKHAKVLISSETSLTGAMKYYQIEQNPNYKTGDLQHLEYFAQLFIGDSGAMTSECAVLGTPAIYVSNKKLGFISDLVNKYELAFHFLVYREGLNKSIELLGKDNLKLIWSQRRKLFLENSIDLTAFLVWLVENYPNSHKLMILNPDYKLKFK